MKKLGKFFEDLHIVFKESTSDLHNKASSCKIEKALKPEVVGLNEVLLLVTDVLATSIRAKIRVK